MDRGLILNIQRYCLHDGPGIRTTVFLKGCPLRCRWCHNPESQLETCEIRVQASRCIRCGCCLEACPVLGAAGATGEAPSEVPPVPPGCVRCGVCLNACPSGARQLVGREMSVQEVAAAVSKDRMFHDQSGGGVTVSGGEPLAQAPFLLHLLETLRDQSIHVALDTSGFAPPDVIRAVAPWVDLFLYDLKSMDDRAHREQTGVSNASILANLEILGEIHDTIWIRIPLVPGFNLEEWQLQASARFIASIPAVRQVNLLPYHRLGSHKAEWGGERESSGIGGSVPPGDLTPRHVEQAASLFRAQGLRTVIGGA